MGLVYLNTTTLDTSSSSFVSFILQWANSTTLTCVNQTEITAYHGGTKVDFIWSESFVDESDLNNPVKERLMKDELFIDVYDFQYITYEITYNTYTFLNGTIIEFFK